MNTRHHLFLQLCTLFAVFSAAVFLGCDEPNSADIPHLPYKLSAVQPMVATAKDVDAKGNYCAVAANTHGALVFDVSNLSNIQEIYHYQVAQFSNCNVVGIDTVHNYVAIGTDNSDPNDTFPIYNYLTGIRSAFCIFSGPIETFIIDAVDDTLKMWATDRSSGDGFVAGRLCRQSDEALWTDNCAFDWVPWNPRRGKIHGMSQKGNIFAIAQETDGIHIHDATFGESLSDTMTVGSAYDCAWYGDFIIVADDYYVTIVNAADLHNPFVVNAYNINSGADRLRKIVIDGNLACLLDENDGIYVVDISDLNNPQFLQLLELSEPTSLCADNGRLYVTDAIEGLLVYTK